ncbi:MAG: SET domain-containing protein [Bacteroidetes bacterium]|nr:SET domain-containing protein [Bacteroidota bacterium]
MQTTPATQTYRLVLSTSIGDVREDAASGQKAFFAGRQFGAGEVLSSFVAEEVCVNPSYLTVQLGDKHHIMLKPAYLQYINHSCNPNCFFDTTNLTVVALRDIAYDEELTFFYPSSEWDMSQPFVCNCRSQQCLGMIRGAKHLSDQQANEYHLNLYIVDKRNLEG